VPLRLTPSESGFLGQLHNIRRVLPASTINETSTLSASAKYPARLPASAISETSTLSASAKYPARLPASTISETSTLSTTTKYPHKYGCLLIAHRIKYFFGQPQKSML